jgi:DNA-binding NarL/FixJ family response regulator
MPGQSTRDAPPTGGEVAPRRSRRGKHDPRHADYNGRLGARPKDSLGTRGAENGVENLTIALGQFRPIIGRGLAQLLSDDPVCRVIATDLDVAALEAFALHQTPHVAILDESAVTGPEVVDRLRAATPALGIVVLAHLPTRVYGGDLLAAGASCLAKEASRQDIISTIHLAARGRQTFVDLPVPSERARPIATRPLTTREAEILGRIRAGETHAQMAETLCISLETVRSHTAKIRRKFRVNSTAELVALHLAGATLSVRPLDGCR